MHKVSLSIAAVLAVLSTGAALASDRSVSLTQDPLVMRLNKDEFASHSASTASAAARTAATV